MNATPTCWASFEQGAPTLYVRLARAGFVFIFVTRRASSEDCAREPRIGWGDWLRVPTRVELYRVRRSGLEHFLGFAEGATFDRLAGVFASVFERARSTNSGHPAWATLEELPILERTIRFDGELQRARARS